MAPVIKKEMVKKLFDGKFIRVFDLQYAEGKHYYDASRRDLDDLVCVKTDEEFRKMYPDAVSIVGILEREGEEPRLLLTQEYRYPAGQFLLSVPAGLIDKEDKEAFRDAEDGVHKAILATAARELEEETGIGRKQIQTLSIINPLLLSTPGMTDESNALVCARICLDRDSTLSQEGALGSECFDGFDLIDQATAREYLRNGRDGDGKFYSVYTWAALMYFVSDMWK